LRCAGRALLIYPAKAKPATEIQHLSTIGLNWHVRNQSTDPREFASSAAKEKGRDSRSRLALFPLRFELEDELASEFERSWIVHAIGHTEVASTDVVVEGVELRVIEGVE
jgi:hypothetical protein